MCNKKRIFTIELFSFLLLVSLLLISVSLTDGNPISTLSISINLDPYSTVYEGDRINCDIQGNPSLLYWSINNKSHHSTFEGNNPVIFNPESTPLHKEYVNLTVYIENSIGKSSDTIPIKLKKIFFGDLHWHTTFSEGDFDIDSIYQNAISDKYLDFTAATDHANMHYSLKNISFPFNTLINKICGKDAWAIMKEKTNEYYDPGHFTTLLGYEWSASNMFPGGYKISPDGCEDVSHINFYYRDVYDDAKKFTMYEKRDYDAIFKAMSDEWTNGNLNIGYVHHPQGKIYVFGSTLVKYPQLIHIPFFQRFVYDFTTNFSYLANNVNSINERNQIFRGVEIYSRWGTSIGPFSNLTVTWPYFPDDPEQVIVCANKTDAWAENGMWEWSQDKFINKKFVMQMGGETHHIDRPGSAFLWRGKPAGIMAVYAVHNTREEIWEALNEGDVYGSQLLKIRAIVRFNDQMMLGRWINCTHPLEITISAMATFPGFDNNGKTMCPFLYPSEELDQVITDIWLIKKDTDKGRPWCKIIDHVRPNNSFSRITFHDKEVKENDFYYVAIRQNGAELAPGQNQYTAFLGPVFIKNVIK